MRKTCRVTIDDQAFSAVYGDTLLDAALKDGIHIPHDCNSGHCGVCRVRVLDGIAADSEGADLEGGKTSTVRACRARIMSDLHLRIETVPEVQTVMGRVAAVRRRSPDVAEVKVEPAKPLAFLPGQYLRVQFSGFPTRCYNPAAAMEEFSEPDFLHFQIGRVAHGHVSAAIGRDVCEGHPVRITGPFGSAFLRPASQSRLVLASAGAGFAAAWAMAVAAIRENQRRRIVIVTGAHTLQSLYMVNALCMLARFPNVTILPVVETAQRVPDMINIGNVADCIPQLAADDEVHVCGPPPLVEAVNRIAAAAGAPCFSVPFVPQNDDRHVHFAGREEVRRKEEARRKTALSRAFGWLSGRHKENGGWRRPAVP